MQVELQDDGTWVRLDEAVESRAVFRKVPWGANRSDVLGMETSEPFHESPNSLHFKVRLGSYTCSAIYVFVNEVFIRGKYVIKEEFQNDNRYLDVYQEFCDVVTKKYGVPIEEQTFWINHTYRSDRTRWGRAVQVGDLQKFSTWEANDSTILVGIMGENFNTEVAIEYNSKHHEGLEDSVREAEMLDEL